jgi:hypothetical protein
MVFEHETTCRPFQGCIANWGSTMVVDGIARQQAGVSGIVGMPASFTFPAA